VPLNLITWNVQWCRGSDGRVSPERIVAAARATADFDVLCLQEVARNFPGLPGAPAGDQYLTLARLLPGYTVIEGLAVNLRAPDGSQRGFGNAVITRLPVLEVFAHLLPWPADPSVPNMQRAALEVVLQTASGPLRVTTAHLEYYSAMQRAAQVERLRDLHAEPAGHANEPVRPEKEGSPFAPMPRPASAILAGDFNFRPEDPLRARLQAGVEGAPAYRDAWEVRHPGVPHTPTLGLFDKKQWPQPAFCSDYIFATEDLESRIEDVQVNASTCASDHQPVLLVLAD
jgi:endonuclease/exonuclease/phosphatase family metal-dependent hydrolase